MFQSKKIAAVAGVLGGFALIGVGAVQAVGAEGSGTCAENDKGNVRCADVNEYRFTSDEYGEVRVDNDMAQTCSGSGAEVSCASSVVVGGKKS
ncbi:hypothetical protein [Streptomyces sp. Tu 3180]|uniref:hypothetical protein n=1 Tax=Streptomyces sp. Tu 3180 TaxID=2682611 RepID=UPI0013596714|nr:hypothetical protein [Streptomyces sp. Tu 3180]KAF3465476.1 hypothetical protein GL259_14790 [Streptomyces sp. Tu 3180]